MTQKIYTKTGDQGNTSLLGGTKLPKSHFRIEAYGTLDELNSYIGLCKDLVDATVNSNSSALEIIQDRLFTIGAILACDPKKNMKMTLPDITEDDCVALETEIDRMDAMLPPMKSFILPGGAAIVSHIHIARCICRRAERSCVRLLQEERVAPLIIKYLNRLSDFLFTLARYTAHLLKIIETPWKPRIF